MHIGKNMGNGEGMRDVGVATLAQLAFVSFFGKDISPLDTADFFHFKIIGEFV
jgi:hypothetical protein